MARWKINLIVLWIGQFLVMGGMTMIIPFLPFYLQELGLKDPRSVALWASWIFAANFVTAFLFQPIWGGLSDRFGRKVMLLRSGFGMAVVMTLMGFAHTAWHLLLLRMLNGVISGFQPAAVALISTNTPKEKIGFAMGTLQSGAVAGTILGPVIGGLLAVGFGGYRPIFYITGTLLFIASLVAFFLVKESFDAQEVKKQPKVSLVQGFKQLSKIPQLPALFAVTFLIQFALLSPMPLIPLFVQKLHGQTEYLALFAALVGSATGFSSIVASPLLGKFGDRIGSERILQFCLIGAAVTFIPQVFVHNIWQLMISRFFLGIFIGGLLPSVYSLIRKFTPNGMESRAYSFNSSTLSLGNMLGPVVGGLLSGLVTIRGIFLLSAILMITNSFWVRRSLVTADKMEVLEKPLD
ncbi:MFS transporter [Paenibacillus psychroresistens]|uniref:MFS transporter n=1 Tax=Paenibacillus psychroresistens TaxID=1778678 RepID=A0A6B8RNP9_9BACL|nr:MFS transporter [Paenibacillus psychroresistens]QGQ97467.1 MFS transporter [Paenibacillus psychroresistens]